MESRGSGATAVEQHLLRAETPGKKGLQAAPSGQAGRTLRWFTTVVLNAAFLGMVRAEAVATCTLYMAFMQHFRNCLGRGRMGTILITAEIDDPGAFQLPQTLLGFCMGGLGGCAGVY